jgi:hypothetical protein
MRLRLVKSSGREPTAVTNGADAVSGEAAVPRTHMSGKETSTVRSPVESASLPEYFRARRILIGNITAAIRYAGQLEHDPEMRRAFFDIALEDSETLDALEELMEKRNAQ